MQNYNTINNTTVTEMIDTLLAHKGNFEVSFGIPTRAVTTNYYDNFDFIWDNLLVFNTAEQGGTSIIIDEEEKVEVKVDTLIIKAPYYSKKTTTTKYKLQSNITISITKEEIHRG